MRQLLRSILPSMFYRRLLLLSSVALVVAVVLASQLTRITLVQGSEWRENAEAALVQTKLVPTVRGRILDRFGRVLAEDHAGYDVAVSYEVITGEWAFRMAASEARRRHKNWSELSPHRQEQLALELVPDFEEQIEAMWQTLSDLTGEPRGEIEKRRNAIVTWVGGIARHQWSVWRRQREELLNQPVALDDVREPIREQEIGHAVIHDVDSRTRARIEGFVNEARQEDNDDSIKQKALAVWLHVSLEPSTRRVYPLDRATVTVDRSTFPGPLQNSEPATIVVEGHTLHLLGSMRDIWREDVEGPRGRPFAYTDEHGRKQIDLGGYRPGDTIGRWGIEQSQENWLRGLRGRRTVQLDSKAEKRIEPVPGRDVTLTIDVELQARVAALMDPSLGLMARQPWHEKELVGPVGEPLNGAAVVLDINTSEVLAAVTVPMFSRETLRTDPNSIWQDHLNRPGINRAVALPYEPGSTIKALVLAAAITDGTHSVNGLIDCAPGYLNPPGNPNQFQCWIHKQYHLFHQDPNGEGLRGDKAICVSCNMFFYTLGRRMGARELVRWYHRFGLGQVTHCGLNEEHRGVLPDLSGPTGPNAPGFKDADGVFMAIGQGPVNWTPIQAASAYATIVRRGLLIPPTFIREGELPTERQTRDLQLNARGVDLVLDGLFDAVNERDGSAHHINIDGQRINNFNIEGVKIYGKSGTAEAAALKRPIDDNNDGYPDRWGEVLRDGDHAWVVCLVQKPESQRPDYVVVVVVEYAGSGGRVSGPLANQILHAMRAQGYF